MQKIFNSIAVASGVLSLTVVGAGLTVYLNKDAIIDDIVNIYIYNIYNIYIYIFIYIYISIFIYTL